LQDLANPVYCDIGEGSLTSKKVNGERDRQCKGHFNQTFIKECNVKCKCHIACNNRVVQRGMKIVVQVSGVTSLENYSVIESSCLISVCCWGFEQVFWTGKRGWGVRTMEPILLG
jgi:hypothetical protein